MMIKRKIFFDLYKEVIKNKIEISSLDTFQKILNLLGIEIENDYNIIINQTNLEEFKIPLDVWDNFNKSLEDLKRYLPEDCEILI